MSLWNRMSQSSRRQFFYPLLLKTSHNQVWRRHKLLRHILTSLLSQKMNLRLEDAASSKSWHTFLIEDGAG